MKRIIFFALIILSIPSASFTQKVIGGKYTHDRVFVEIEKEPKVRKKIPVKYQGEASIGFGANFGYYYNYLGNYDNSYTIYLETVHGVLISKYFFIGAGFNLHYFLNKKIGSDSYDYYDYSVTSIYFPIFLNLKGIYPINNDWKTYITANVGSDVLYDEVYAKGGVGVQYKRFFIDAGFQMHLDIGCYCNVGIRF